MRESCPKNWAETRGDKWRKEYVIGGSEFKEKIRVNQERELRYFKSEKLYEKYQTLLGKAIYE